MEKNNQTTCYVVVRREEYESDIVHCVFGDKAAAEEFCEKCNEYQLKAPICMSSFEIDNYLKWEKDFASWRRAHPANEMSSEEALENDDIFQSESFKVIETLLLKD